MKLTKSIGLVLIVSTCSIVSYRLGQISSRELREDTVSPTRETLETKEPEVPANVLDGGSSFAERDLFKVLRVGDGAKLSGRLISYYENMTAANVDSLLDEALSVPPSYKRDRAFDAFFSFTDRVSD